MSYFFYNIMNVKNNKGSRIDPCGIIALIKHQSDEAPSRTTHCFLSLR